MWSTVGVIMHLTGETPVTNMNFIMNPNYGGKPVNYEGFGLKKQKSAGNFCPDLLHRVYFLVARDTHSKF